MQAGRALPLRGSCAVHEHLTASLPGSAGPTFMLEAVLTHVLDELAFSCGSTLLDSMLLQFSTGIPDMNLADNAGILFPVTCLRQTQIRP